MQSLKAQKGVSLLVLCITIVIMLILSTTIILSYSSIHASTLKKEFAKEIYSIQKVIEQYKFMNNIFPVTNDIDIDLSTLDAVAKTQFSNEDKYDTGTITLKKIDLVEAGVENVKRGTMVNSDLNDIYVFSPKTHKVYYLKGENISKQIYYTLTDELKKQIDLSI
ncbi:MAG: hypothetical protein RSB76_00325 [Clostridia bacterium]